MKYQNHSLLHWFRMAHFSVLVERLSMWQILLIWTCLSKNFVPMIFQFSMWSQHSSQLDLCVPLKLTIFRFLSIYCHIMLLLRRYRCSQTQYRFRMNRDNEKCVSKKNWFPSQWSQATCGPNVEVLKYIFTRFM